MATTTKVLVTIIIENSAAKKNDCNHRSKVSWSSNVGHPINIEFVMRIIIMCPVPSLPIGLESVYFASST